MGAPKRILIVDDENSVRNVLGKMLTKQGYFCTTAASAEEARGFLKKETFDLILCDIDMPTESGLDFIRKDLPNHTSTGVIMVTGIEDDKIAEFALELGAYDYIVKPIELNRLHISVSNALRRIKQETANRHYVEELKLAQEQRISLEKLKGIMEMAGAVCHELNQPLQAIMGLSALLLIELEEDHPQYEKIQKIHEQVEKVGRITGKLMGITRYESKEYGQGIRIVDLDKSSSPMGGET
ncbi:MAG: response regulator [Deltaproteobacteria bacterium]|nr:response regulator [Deltaproteobacteria bacterium]